MNKDFGKYTIEKELGKGGMATVYLGVHKDLGRRVALKVMHPHLAADADARARFENEARAIARLEHVNILQIYDFGGFESNFYIAMELIDGQDVERLLKENGPLPPEVAAIIFFGIASGLHQAHLHQIIHRDIKLSNIIVKTDGLVKLSDFGIVKMEDAGALTHSNSIVGTPYYIAPEQIDGAKASPQSDIYSLGVSMYYSLCGQYPFKAESLPVVLNAISMGKYLPLHQTGTYVPPELALIVERCMQRDPKSRYENALLISQDLNSFLYKKQVANDATTLACYLKGPKQFSEQLRCSSLKVKFERAKVFKEKEMVFEALQEYESILQEDPDNKEVQQEVARLAEIRLSRSRIGIDMQTMVLPRKRKKPWKWIGIASTIAVLAVAGFIFFGKRNSVQPVVAPSWKDTVLAAAGRVADSLVSDTSVLLPSALSSHQIQSHKSVESLHPKKEALPKPSVPEVMAPAQQTPPVVVPEKTPVPSDTQVSTAPSCIGSLFVFSELWGSIYLSGKKIGDAPTKNKIPVACGEYDLRIENPGGKTYTEAVVIRDGEICRRQIKETDFK